MKTSDIIDSVSQTVSQKSDGREAMVDAVFDILAADTSLIDVEEESDSRLWVLCIDDDADFGNAMGARFEANGWSVIRALDGMTGYRTANSSQAAAIVLDYNMPNGRGDYVLSRLKEDPRTRDVPVFVVTGQHDRQIQERMSILGAAGYFNKPVDFRALFYAIQDTVDR